MKNLFAAIAATVLMGAGSYALADSSCGAAKSECAKSCSEKVANSDCAKSCDSAEKVGMAKGGADASNLVEGYGLGQRVPAFTLTDSAGKSFSLEDTRGSVTVLMFYNHYCPFVVEVVGRFSDFTRTYGDKGVKVFAIDAGADKTVADIAKHQAEVPYTILVNQTSELARAFNATRTPEVFVLNKDGVIAYHGMFDTGKKGVDSGNLESFTARAVDALLAGEEPAVKQTKAFGCTIKFAKTN